MLNVKIVKTPAFLKGEVLVQPEIEDALETIGARLERRGKGAGERRNQMNRTRGTLMHRFLIETEHNPRRTGWAKKAYMRRVFNSMAPNVLKKAFTRIADRWAA